MLEEYYAFNTICINMRIHSLRVRIQNPSYLRWQGGGGGGYKFHLVWIGEVTKSCVLCQTHICDMPLPPVNKDLQLVTPLFSTVTLISLKYVKHINNHRSERPLGSFLSCILKSRSKKQSSTSHTTGHLLSSSKRYQLIRFLLTNQTGTKVLEDTIWGDEKQCGMR